MTIDVLLSGRLKLDGYGRNWPQNRDGTFRLELRPDGTVPEVIEGMGVPPDRVALTMVNGRISRNLTNLKSGDRVILIPSDVAALWRHLGVMNMGQESVFDF